MFNFNVYALSLSLLRHAKVGHKVTELRLYLIVNLSALFLLCSRLCLLLLLSLAVLLCLFRGFDLLHSFKFLDLSLFLLGEGHGSLLLALLCSLLPPLRDFFLATELHLVEVFGELDEGELFDVVLLGSDIGKAPS